MIPDTVPDTCMMNDDMIQYVDGSRRLLVRLFGVHACSRES